MRIYVSEPQQRRRPSADVVLDTRCRCLDRLISRRRDVEFGFTDDKMLKANPSLIISHVRLYGTNGPWASKSRFDMQVSASSGFMTICGGDVATPSWPPGTAINDYTNGYFGAVAIQTAILRRIKEGGGYVLSPSLPKTAMTIVKHFKSSQTTTSSGTSPLPPDEIELQTGIGLLRTLKPLPVLNRTPISYGNTTLDPMGSSSPVFPGDEQSFDVHKVTVIPKEVMKSMQQAALKKTRLLQDIAA